MSRALPAGPVPGSDPPRRTGRIYLWVPKRLMIDMDYLFEAFEGLALVRTLDTRLGLMEVMHSPGAETEIEEVVRLITATYPEIRRAGPSAAPALV